MEHNISELVCRTVNGDMQAFETLYRISSQKVYYTCLSFMRNEQDAADVMQEAYMLAFTHLSTMRNPERFVQWVNQIAANRCRNLLTSRQPELLAEEVLEGLPLSEDDISLPENFVVDEAKRKLLMDLMKERLSAVQYETVVLYYFDELTIEEIASAMECPAGTVSYRLSVARVKIKQAVLDYEERSGEKLHVYGGLVLLGAIFTAELQGLPVPDVLGNIMNMFMPDSVWNQAGASYGQENAGTYGGQAGASYGQENAGTYGGQAGASEVADAAVATGVKTAAKTGFLATAKAKVTAAVVAVLLVGGAVGAGIALSNRDDNSSTPRNETGQVSENQGSESASDEDDMFVAGTDGYMEPDASEASEEEGPVTESADEENTGDAEADEPASWRDYTDREWKNFLRENSIVYNTPTDDELKTFPGSIGRLGLPLVPSDDVPGFGFYEGSGDDVIVEAGDTEELYYGEGYFSISVIVENYSDEAMTGRECIENGWYYYYDLFGYVFEEPEEIIDIYGYPNEIKIQHPAQMDSSNDYSTFANNLDGTHDAHTAYYFMYYYDECTYAIPINEIIVLSEDYSEVVEIIGPEDVSYVNIAYVFPNTYDYEGEFVMNFAW